MCNILKIHCYLKLYVTIIICVCITTLNAQDSVRTITIKEYTSKMKAGWLGQMAGVGWGAPTEFQYVNRIIPEDELPQWKPEMVNVFNQDDLYVEMTFLRSLEQYGLDVSMRQAGIDFANSKYMLWHANKAGRDNLRNGIAPPDAGHPYFNSHADDIDYQIEADYSGLISPGLPNSVIALGEKFGRLMNYGDGVYGGQFVGGMYAEAFFENDPQKIVEAGLKCIPEGSQYAEMVRNVIKWFHENPDDWQKTWQKVNTKYHETPDYTRWLCTPQGEDFNIDAKINGAYIVMGLLYSKGDLDQSMIISMRCGQDSDCNPSNAAGVLFTRHNYEDLPEKYLSALDLEQKFSYTEYNFESLVDVCVKLAGEIIIQAGGRVDKNEQGEDVFIIPVQQAQPGMLEKSWEAGPIAGSTFTSKEFPHLKWKWILSPLVWVLLLLAFVLFKENRNVKALWIAAPIITVYLIWEILSALLSDQLLSVDKSIVINQTLGLAILFLLGEKLAKLKWPVLMGSSFFVLLIISLLGMLAKTEFYFEGPGGSEVANASIGGLVIVAALALTSRQVPNLLNSKRFLLYLLMWIFIVQVVLSLVVSLIVFGVDAFVEYYNWFLMIMASLVVLQYLVTLPFWILGLTNNLYKQRFKSCLKLPGSDNSMSN